MEAKAAADCAIDDGQASGHPRKDIVGLMGFLGRLWLDRLCGVRSALRSTEQAVAKASAT